MKRKLIIFLLFITSLSLWANDMSVGNSFLQKGKFEDAIREYERLVNEDYVGFELFYNLGSAYEMKGDKFNALLNFEKALLVKPASKIAIQRVNNINAGLPDHPPVFDQSGILLFFNRIQYGLSIDTWAILSIVFMLFLPVTIFSVYKFPSLKFKKLLFSLNLVWFILSGLCVLMARNGYHHRYMNIRGLVNKETITVKSLPEENAAIVFNLHHGTSVEVEDSSNHMYFIRFANQEGWIAKSDINRIHL